jgi:hypothetical protein
MERASLDTTTQMLESIVPLIAYESQAIARTYLHDIR